MRISTFSIRLPSIPGFKRNKITMGLWFIALTTSFAFTTTNGNASGKTIGQRSVVTVIEREPKDVSVQFTVFGIVSAHYQQIVTSEVNGRVIQLSKRLEPGYKIVKDEVLVVVESSSYEATLASAEHTLASAELALLQEDQRGKQAKQDWERAKLKNKQASDLVLRKPFLKQEALNVKAARAALVEAQRNLKNTTIRAPFDAVVMSRNVTPSGYITAGQQLAEIYSTDLLQTDVGLSAQQWKLLLFKQNTRLPLDNIQAEVSDDLGIQWEAKVVSFGATAQTETRQQSLRLNVQPVNEAGIALRPGQFVNVRLTGRVLSNILLVPASSVTAQGYLWTVSKDNRMKRHSVSPVFTHDGNMAIRANDLKAAGTLRILVNPLRSYFPDQIVNPRTPE